MPENRQILENSKICRRIPAFESPQGLPVTFLHVREWRGPRSNL